MDKRVLVLRLSSLGDVVLTAPVFRNLKARWPEARLAVMVKPQFAPAIAANPCVDEVIPYRGLRAALRDIRERGITHLLDLHGTWRTFWIRTLSRVPNVSAYRKDALARRLFVLFRWDSPALVKHTLDRYLEALKAWDVPVVHRDLSLGDYSPPQVRPRSSRVLLLQTSFLGDTLLTLPLARRVKEVLPGCRLTVLTRPQTAEVFRSSPWVDEVIEDDKRGRHRGVGGLFSLAQGLRGRFDLALVAHRSFRSALMVWLARVPFRIGFSSSTGWFFFHRTVLFSWAMPELERNLGLLLPLSPGLKAAGADSIYLRGRAEAAKEVDRLLASPRPAEAPLVGLHPGSAWQTKRWLPERFAALARRLMAERGARVVLLGGPEDAELCRRIAADAPGCVDAAGKTTLPQLMELVGRLELLVTNDSGPMHVAAASGVPTLALFGPTTRELGFFPYGEGHRVIEKDLDCRPCGLHGARACPEGHFLCMRLISVSEVFDAASEMLGVGTAAGSRP
ncbi:MAG TPA: lipopolysaccharide heptosyltransferase II, partial [Elusimicrobiota bacterium]|nr:lipopolysaccharide heptosyltransferase II [Elusimicrobiota bacterium]